jgi:uncharacterized protein (DUF608 family)
MEMMPNGSINFITFRNNWSEPIYDAEHGAAGFHFGLFTESGGRRCARLLQTGGVRNFPKIGSIEYEGTFPLARLVYKDKELPLDAELLSFSSFIPGNLKDSSLPGAFFKFRLRNNTKNSVSASFLATGRNISGDWSVGRFNQIKKSGGMVSLSFRNMRNGAKDRDPLLGEFSISVPKGTGEVTYLGEWNLQGGAFNFEDRDLRLDAWDYFSIKGELPNRNSRNAVRGESEELGGALAVKFTLEAGEEKDVTFIYSWSFPRHRIGHRYSRWFSDSLEVSAYMFKHERELRAGTERWQSALASAGMPDWFADALTNSLYPLSSSTWYGRDGRFITYEAPLSCPLMGTMDVRFYGSLPLGLFFPKLEKSVVEQFALAQRDDGYIPHDLGRMRIDLPSDGTTCYKWKDLAPKFALICYRDYLNTGDKSFLRKVYPSVKRAMEWEFRQDKNGDSLPDNEGQDQTFDVWPFYGANTYTSGIYLAALLACSKMARACGKGHSERVYKERFRKGRESFEKILWNGMYFSNYVSEEKGRDDSCTAAQLNGQWYAHLLGLGYIADKLKVRKAVSSILRLNTGVSKYGLAGSVLPDGRLNHANRHAANIFPGMSYAFAALCIYEGFVKEGMDIAKNVWDNLAYNIKTPWNQPDLVDIKSGEPLFGEYYMRNMAVWAVFLALAARRPRVKKALRTIKRI